MVFSAAVQVIIVKTSLSTERVESVSPLPVARERFHCESQFPWRGTDICQIDKDVLVKKRRIAPGKTAIDGVTGICKHVHRVQEI